MADPRLRSFNKLKHQKLIKDTNKILLQISSSQPMFRPSSNNGPMILLFLLLGCLIQTTLCTDPVTPGNLYLYSNKVFSQKQGVLQYDRDSDVYQLIFDSSCQTKTMYCRIADPNLRLISFTPLETPSPKVPIRDRTTFFAVQSYGLNGTLTSFTYIIDFNSYSANNFVYLSSAQALVLDVFESRSNVHSPLVVPNYICGTMMYSSSGVTNALAMSNGQVETPFTNPY